MRVLAMVFLATAVAAQNHQTGIQQINAITLHESESVTLPACDEICVPHEFDRRQFDNIDDTPKIAPSWWPHPYIDAALAVMPGGYFPVAAYGEFGGEIERAPFLAHGYLGYDNGHKTNDGDQPNPKGHDRYLGAGAAWRIRRHAKWFTGAGWQWNQLSTTNYTKTASRPYFGGGYDLFFDHSGSSPNGEWNGFSARLTLDYFTAGTDWQNGSHGVGLGVVMPRPIEKRHLFLVFSFDLFRTYETVTEPTNLPLTLRQRADRFFDADCSTGIMYRFR
jgi:hypothetical protein